MRQDKEEIVEELKHQQEMIKVLRRRRREREKQAAQYGIDVPPHISSEVEALREDIREREKEISLLETALAENQYSLSEAEYRGLLAEELNKSNGHLSFVVSSRIELARLKLGLQEDRAKELEIEVRTRLAEETLYSLPDNFSIKVQQAQRSAPKKIHELRRRAIDSLRIALNILDASTNVKKIMNKPHIDAEIRENERSILDKIDAINNHTVLFPDVSINRSIVGARNFMDNISEGILQQQGVNVPRRALGVLIEQELRGDLAIITRGIRLHPEITWRKVTESTSDIELDIVLLGEALYSQANLQQGDKERLEYFLILFKE